jgi:hypothetical protein
MVGELLKNDVQEFWRENGGRHCLTAEDETSRFILGSVFQTPAHIHIIICRGLRGPYNGRQQGVIGIDEIR